MGLSSEQKKMQEQLKLGAQADRLGRSHRQRALIDELDAAQKISRALRKFSERKLHDSPIPVLSYMKGILGGYDYGTPHAWGERIDVDDLARLLVLALRREEQEAQALLKHGSQNAQSAKAPAIAASLPKPPSDTPTVNTPAAAKKTFKKIRP